MEERAAASGAETLSDDNSPSTSKVVAEEDCEAHCGDPLEGTAASFTLL